MKIKNYLYLVTVLLALDI